MEIKKSYDLRGRPIPEKKIQDDIRAAIGPFAHCYNVTTGRFKVGKNRWITTFPKGTPDLMGFRKSDGKAFFIEVKSANGRLSKEQKAFARYIKDYDVLYGVARDVGDAFEILEVEV